MTAPLVDAEDYPRGDIDLYKVRNARQRINCLQNDLNALMKEITEGLEQHFSELKVESKEDTPGTTEEPKVTPDPVPAPQTVNKEAFAVVDSVADGSPAFDAGLRTKDEILEFGSLNANNFQNLQQFAEIAQHKLNQRVPLLVKRKRENGSHAVETVQLVPKKWAGRGYLGMVVKPLERL